MRGIARRAAEWRSSLAARLARNRPRHFDRHVEQQLRHSLAERIEPTRRRPAAVEGLVQDEVHRVDARKMEALDLALHEVAEPSLDAGRRESLPEQRQPLGAARDHAERRALELFAREIAPAGTSWSPGTTGAGGRPQVSPLVKPFSFLLDKHTVPATFAIGDERRDVAMPLAGGSVPRPSTPVVAPLETAPLVVETAERVPLVLLAWARSGDKGDLSNVGVVARRAEWLPLLWDRLTPMRVKAWLGHLVLGEVERFHLPGIAAINFVLHQALDGGGMSSRRLDPLGKGMAQMLLDMPIEVPRSIARDAREET